MIQAQSGGNSPKYGPKGLGGPIAKTVYEKVKGKSLPSVVKRETVTGTLKGARGPVPARGYSVGKAAPEQTPRVPSKGNPESITGSKGGAMGPRPSVGKPAPEQTPRIASKGNPESITGSKGGKPKATPDVPTPGNRPAKPAPAAPSVYRAKKGDGLWQVAEKTKPAGTSTAAWWTKIKKLNSTNGKVNRTYTGTGVKLPKA